MNIVGIFAIGLMAVVIVIAAGSLIVAATIPIGNWLQKRRDARANAPSSRP